MPVTTDPGSNYMATRDRRHPECWVCAPQHLNGLNLVFEFDGDGTVVGDFSCGKNYMGYPDYLHGGVVSSLLDGAMTNCLMARGTPGLTGKLEVRFLKPVLIDVPVTVRGWWEKSRGPLHFLAAELVQEGQVQARATGRVMEFPEENT
jgi:acyl-coenzyme A thioesterase PaaI-like protein